MQTGDKGWVQHFIPSILFILSNDVEQKSRTGLTG